MLKRLESLDRPIRIALVGTGSAGKGLLYQSGVTPGMECVAIADIAVSKAVQAAEEFGRPYRLVERQADLEDAIAAGLLAVCEDGQMLALCASADVYLDASSAIPEGGRFALSAIETGKDVVMMNAEADLAFGPHLARLAREHGRVYTSCDGDQPGRTARLIRDLRLWGFDLVMAGNIKGFLDRYANPTSIVPEAEKRFLDPKMCAGYTDGTKLCVEMALLANAFGLDTLVPGMHGPRATDLSEVFDLYDLEAIWEAGTPVVDYVLGAPPYGGVFAIGRCADAYQQSMLGWFPSRIGPGPFYVFNRPYHLIHIEAMQCVAEAFLEREALLEPAHGLRTDVYAYAKRDLHRGDVLDGIGGYACYGLIENRRDQGAGPAAGVPICLADRVTVAHDIAKDDKILMGEIEYDPGRFDWSLYALAAAEGVALDTA